MTLIVSQRETSSTESCGFVTYVLCHVLALLYLLWIIVPDELLHTMDITYYPPKSVALYLPTFIILMFLSIPILYSFVNHLSAPKCDSLDVLCDAYSREPKYYLNKQLGENEQSNVPEICDLDVSIINRAILRNIKKNTTFN